MKRGKRVKTLQQLEALARSGRAVFVASWKRPSSAAWLMGMQARCLLLFLESGIYEYRKESAK